MDSAAVVREVSKALAKNWAKVTAITHRVKRGPPTLNPTLTLTPTKVTALFTEWDVDGDGRISAAELRRAMKVLFGDSFDRYFT